MISGSSLASDWVLGHLVGEEVREYSHGRIILLNSFLSVLGSGCSLGELLLDDAIFHFLGICLNFFLFCVLLHLIEHA